jgi:PRTRC genetic system ThiF family protein
MQKIVHRLEYKLADPVHPVKILLVGVGGTGSQVLNCLARISYALKKLGHPGFHVIAMDGDVVEEFNVGRQLFSQSEIGLNKSVCAVSKINRFFGFSWEASSDLLTDEVMDWNYTENPNLIISCVDNVEARRVIANYSSALLGGREFQTYYWMDFGNNKNAGQVILGSIKKAEGFEGEKDNPILRNVFDFFPKMEKFEKDAIQGPSCSMAEALGKQDLFINSILAQLGSDILWKLFFDKQIVHQGVFVNTSTMGMAPIVIKPKLLKRR